MLLALVVAGVCGVIHVLDGKDYDYVASWSPAGHPPALDPVTVSANQKTITISYWGGDCDDHAEAEVEESPKQVAVTILVSESDREFCNAMAYSRTIDVHLAEPLADRVLVDGS